MSRLRNYLNKVRPHFEKGGKLHAFRSVFDGMETFLYVPNTTSVSGCSIHDPIDSKRIMSMVVIALIPALLWGMFNVGYQNFKAAGMLDGLVLADYVEMFAFGFLAVLPKIIVSYVVGLGIEFAWAAWKNEEIQEGFLVSGLLIPMILPVGCPLWMLAVATAFAVVFAKEIFGGTGMNIFNVALVTRAFLFFSYPTAMSGDTVWVASESIFGLGHTLADGATHATPLALAAQGNLASISDSDLFFGFVAGSIGETSVVAIAIGAVLLLLSGIASWRTMASVFAGGLIAGVVFQLLGMTEIKWYEQFIMGGFAFGAVFMATDPVTSARTGTGQYVFGIIIGLLAVLIRVMNPGYPEGMMLAILFGNMVAPLIDHVVVERNVAMRMKRKKDL